MMELTTANPIKLKAKRRKPTVGSILQVVLAVTITGIMVFPLYWMLITSVKSQSEVLLSVPTWWPTEFHFENYSYVLGRANFSKYYLNTIIVTAGILILQTVTGVLAAYGFSRGSFKGRDTLFYVVLGALMIPIQITFLPLYIMCANMGLSDTYLGLILPEAVSPYFIFMMRNTFLSIDQSYIDAAHVDGVGHLGLICRILIPMSKASLVTVILVTFTSGWNMYFWPKLIAKSEDMRVLSVGLAALKSTFGGSSIMNNHQVMAGAVLAILPVVVFFFIFQKYMLSGYSHAAMK